MMGNETEEALERGLNNPKERKEEVLQEVRESGKPQEIEVENKGKIEEISEPYFRNGNIDVPMIENPIKPKKKRLKLAPRQVEMIKNLIKAKGIVTIAAEKTGINPWTHYEWIKTNEDYRTKLSEVELRVEDVIENAFLNLVVDKNPQAVIHAVKTKLRKRGYGEKVEITSDVNVHGGLSFENDPREIMRRIEERRRKRAEQDHS